MLAAARSQGFLSRLPEALVDQIVRGGQRVSYAAGATIPVDDGSPWMAVVLTGCLRMYLVSPDGGQVTLRYLKPGDIVGAVEAWDIARAVQALVPSDVLHVDSMRFFALVRKDPALAWELIQEMASLIGLTYRSFGIRTFGSIQRRVASAIYERAKACGGATRGTVIVGTQQELAAASGTVREVVAPALHALRNEGIIEIRRGAVVILDPERLAVEAEA